MVMFDTEKFIYEVAARPPLYDIQSKDYANREIKTKCWLEIGSSMYRNWNSIEEALKDEKVKDLTKKWKAIRDSFVKDYRAMVSETGKAASSKKRYIYYDQLQFLLPYVKGNQKTISNIVPPTIEDGETATQREEQSTNGPTLTSTSENGSVQAEKGKRKRSFGNPNMIVGKGAALEKSSSSMELRNILIASLEMQKEERNSDKYGHKAFLLSFVPALDSMPYNESMQLRSQIAQIFANHFGQLQQDS